MSENELATEIIVLAIQVHKTLGPGLLENVYKECLNSKIIKRGIIVEKEKPLPVIFEDVRLECGYRIDLIVENKLVLEIKSVEFINDIHLAQTLTYLKIGDYKLGLLINFNTIFLKNGLKRVINGKL